MKKKIVSLVMALAMIVCLAPGVAGVAKAGKIYTLIFDANGGHVGTLTGTEVKEETYTSSNAVGSLCNSTIAYREGYIFQGWYTERNGGAKIATNYSGTPVRVYAHWSERNPVYNQINSKFTGGAFGNAFTNNGFATYNMGYAKLFYGTNGGSWCTDSAMMDLLNRRLAKDNKLSQYTFFDLRDVVFPMAMSPNFAITNLGTGNSSVLSNGKQTVTLKNTNGVAFSNSGEICNPGKPNETRLFKTYYGRRASTYAEYRVSFVHYSGMGRNDASYMQRTVMELLNNHPEGIFVYVNTGNHPHAFLIVGYTKAANGSVSFKYVDNGGWGSNYLSDGKGIRNFWSTCMGYSDSNHARWISSEANMLKSIVCIAYVKN